MTHESGGFYSALDADSEGVEGKFYTWTQAELDEILGKNSSLISAYYQTKPTGNWEDGVNILHVNHDIETFALAYNISPADFSAKLQAAKIKLLDHRSGRIRPGLDDKILAGWNGLMLKGLADAYAAFGEEKFLKLALANAHFLKSQMIVEGQLFRNFKNGKSTIQGYLEDYALVIEALIRLYEVTFDESWLALTESLLEYSINNFFDEQEGFFFYTDSQGETLIARKKELLDNVISSSNSVMATNLFKLGKILDREDLINTSRDMLAKVTQLMEKEISYLSNWGVLYTYFVQPIPEIIIVGKEADQFRAEIEQKYLPQKVIGGTTQSSDLPLLQHRTAVNDQTTIYVCFNKTCKLSVNTVDEAIEQLAQ